MITEKIYMMVSVANYELNDDDREKTGVLFLVHNKLQRFNYVVLNSGSSDGTTHGYEVSFFTLSIRAHIPYTTFNRMSQVTNFNV